MIKRILGGMLYAAVLLGGCSSSAGPAASFNDNLKTYELSMTPAIASGRSNTRTDSPDENHPLWLAAEEDIGARSTTKKYMHKNGKAKGQYTPWPKRRGPAYPGDFWRSFGRDLKELPATIWDDTKATFTDEVGLIGMGLAGGAGIALANTDADDEVEDHYSEHGSQLNTFWDTVGDVGGNPGAHFAVAGAMYFTSLAKGDTKTYEVSQTLLNALAVNGATTLALKGVVNSEVPNGGKFGWPSGHTSSSFCFATVLQEAYGPWVGVPLYAFASYVGYERVDARNHDFSDVISGAIIGTVIGHTVSQNHKARIFGMEVVPVTDPSSGLVGLGLTKQW